MIVSMHRFNILALYKLKIFSLFVLSALFLVSCGGGGGSSGGDTSSSVDYSVSFYDENLDFIETVPISDIQSGTWYIAGGDTPATKHDLADDIRLYAVQNVTEITTQGQLANITTDETTLAGNYILLESIDLVVDGESFDGVEGWKPIGNDTNPFTGIFNGNFNQITNLWINRTLSSNVGFFGSISGAQIRNLGVEIAEGKEVRGDSSVGGIAGFAKAISNGNDNIPVIIINSYSIGNIIGDHSVGGIVGEISGLVETYDNNGETVYVCLYADIANSYSSANISGSYAIGGIAGLHNGNTVNSYTNGIVNGTSDMVGGIAGMNYVGSITNSYSSADVYGRMVTGGIVGLANTGSIIQHNAAINIYVNSTDNYKTDRITGDISRYVGEISNNLAFEYMMITPTGDGDNQDIGNEAYSGISTSMDEFKKQLTYENLEWKFGYNNTNPWKINENNTLPSLYWE